MAHMGEESDQSMELQYYHGTPNNNINSSLKRAKSASHDESSEDLLSTRTVLSGFVDFTTSHGITHIYKTSGIVKKIFWILLSLIGLGMLCVHLWYIFDSWLANDVTTGVSVSESRSLLFPAVTICNVNAIRLSMIPNDIQTLISSRRTSLLDGSDSKVSNKGLYKRIAEDVSLLPESNKSDNGYPLSEMVLYCSFNGINCDMGSDFWRFYDSTYGNCYTFNSGKVSNGTLKYATSAGHLNGLSLVVNAGVYDYVPGMTEEAGARVVIHNQTDMPFPSQHSFAANVGASNYLAIRKVQLTRLDGRYGNCTARDATSVSDNMYYDPYQAQYTHQACMNTCYQKEVVSSCQCFDSAYPYSSTYDAFSSLSSVTGPCFSKNETQSNCLEKGQSDYSSGALACSNCFSTCEEARFKITRSANSYPADTYIEDFVTKLEMTHPEVMSKVTHFYQNTSVNSAVTSNVMKINVFYEFLGYTTYAQQVSYSDEQFVSDLGGAFGLWVGWSVLTFFEFFEFFFDLLKYCCYNRVAQKKTQDIDDIEH